MIFVRKAEARRPGSKAAIRKRVTVTSLWWALISKVHRGSMKKNVQVKKHHRAVATAADIPVREATTITATIKISEGS